jgi:GNAT superfamily N-acetyltransferase
MKLKTYTNSEMLAEFPHLINNNAMEDRLEFFSLYPITGDSPDVPKTHILAINEEDLIVGAALFSGEKADPKMTHLEYVSVDPNYRNRGLARQLTMAVFEHIKALGDDYRVNLGGFTYDGDAYLRKIVRDGVERFPDMITAEPDDQSFEDWLDGKPVDDFSM